MLTICAYAASEHTPTRMTSALVAHGTHVGDSHENRTVWFGLHLIAPEEFRRRTFLRSPRLLVEVNILLDFVQYAVSADWKDDKNWAVVPQAQEAER